MQLSSLIAGLDIQPATPRASAPADEAAITSLSVDSRSVAPGALFVALAGTKADGSRFIADAVAKGAAAVLVSTSADLPAGLTVPALRAVEPRLALARLAARFYGEGPAIALAVTGTSGKTSVAEFTRQILTRLGRKAASLGTIGVIAPGLVRYGSLTTPDPITLHKTLAELSSHGVTHLAFEASSHGLDQFRLDGVPLTAAAFTNLGRDHLDYHPTTEAYFAAKLRLFTERLEPGKTAVINADGARASDVESAAHARGLKVFSVGANGHELRLVSREMAGFRQRLTIEHNGKSYAVELPLIGAYQVENALVAAGLAIAAGEAVDQTLDALPHLEGVKGRLEIAGEKNGGLAVVDYAHKPEALVAALEACRPFATGKLICVFGCGGDRDRGKRPIMGEISTRLADVTIVTDDNPRTEVPAAIRAEILAAAPGAIEIGDRAEAIAAAVAQMGPGDVVLVAGKGHETGQILADKTIDFSDHATIRDCLARL